MGGIVTVRGSSRGKVADQRRATIAALERGDSRAAVPIDQAFDRAAYIETTWKGSIVREGNVGADDTLWANFLERGANSARSVARVIEHGAPAERNWRGTAFFISDWLVMTNHHVLDSEETAAAAAMELAYEFNAAGEPRPVTRLRLDPERFFVAQQTGETLDYAVCAVAGRSGRKAPGKTFGHLPLIERRGKVTNGDPLNLIHHPSGGLKRVTIRESRLLGMAAHTLQYSGDTLGGSSGAPVLNDQWEVVALHFGGSPKRDENGRRLTVDGQLWEQGMPDAKAAYEFNVGTRVSVLVADLRKQARDLPASARALLTDAIGAAE